MYWKIIYSISKLTSLLICMCFILSGVMNTFIGGLNKIIQLITIFLSFFICILCLLRGEKKGVSLLLLFVFLLLIIIPFFSDIGYLNTISSLAFLYNVFLGYILFNNKKIVAPILYSILLANFIFILIETFLGIKIVIPSDGYEISSYSFLYKFGVFSAPKDGGFFILIVGVLAYMQKRPFILLIAFISSLFSGVRISTIVLLLPMLLLGSDYLREKSKNLSYIILLMLCVPLYFVIDFFVVNEVVLSRLFSSVSFSDASNLDRFYYWEAHFSLYKGFPIENMFWGNYGIAYKHIGNGAENAFLELLTNGGFLAFFLYFLPLIYSTWLYMFNNKFFFIFPLFFFTLLTGRFSLGFYDGPILWMIFFIILSGEGEAFFHQLYGSNNLKFLKSYIIKNK